MRTAIRLIVIIFVFCGPEKEADPISSAAPSSSKGELLQAISKEVSEFAEPAIHLAQVEPWPSSFGLIGDIVEYREVQPGDALISAWGNTAEVVAIRITDIGPKSDYQVGDLILLNGSHAYWRTQCRGNGVQVGLTIEVFPRGNRCVSPFRC